MGGPTAHLRHLLERDKLGLQQADELYALRRPEWHSKRSTLSTAGEPLPGQARARRTQAGQVQHIQACGLAPSAAMVAMACTRSPMLWQLTLPWPCTPRARAPTHLLEQRDEMALVAWDAAHRQGRGRVRRRGMA